jgi:hypothetical protein
MVAWAIGAITGFDGAHDASLRAHATLLHMNTTVRFYFGIFHLPPHTGAGVDAL